MHYFIKYWSDVFILFMYTFTKEKNVLGLVFGNFLTLLIYLFFTAEVLSTSLLSGNLSFFSKNCKKSILHFTPFSFSELTRARWEAVPSGRRN